MRGRFEALLYGVASIGTSLTPSLAFTPISRRPTLTGAVHHRHGRAASIERDAMKLKMSDDEKEDNFIASLIRNVMQNNIGDASINMESVETEDEKQQRLRVERLAQIEAGEVRRQSRVAEDKFGYLLLFALQLLPLIGRDRVESIVYFFGVAVCTVYLGGRQEVIDRPERVSRDNALYAPVGASLAIGGLYLLLKMGIDITSVYAIMVTVFGALAISDIGVPLLRNAFPGIDFAAAEVPVPTALAEKTGLDNPRLPLDGSVTLGLGVLCTLIYWAPAAMEQKFLISNAIAWALGMVSLGAISLGSFQTGAILLAGLFCYDVFWVFGTDVMMTVATKVEAPVKFLYPAPLSDTPRAYPFSVLGLGDVVIPGLFLRLMYKVDEALQPKNLSYFNVATGAYAAGLLMCFAANELFHNGQPALLYLDPSLVGGTLACASVNGQVNALWDFQEEENETN
ncbi:hypothetical protein ACHAW5_009723 [Stephanodiscus triporus]|uniref:Signal peptide peptidase n=1 Tax=Stephanodiscus triporus TaxID=2934178 RepID=A0ABD3QPW5_9STRA